MQPLAVDVNEAAHLLAVSSYTVRRMLRDGRLRAVRIGRCVRVSVESLEELARRPASKDRALQNSAMVA
jgi:excisionase family DNA binding protein